MSGLDRGLKAAIEIQTGDIPVVQGPPGTGRSRINGLIYQYAHPARAVSRRDDAIARGRRFLGEQLSSESRNRRLYRTFYEGRLNAAMADQWRHSVLLGGEAGALPPKLFLRVDHEREDT